MTDPLGGQSAATGDGQSAVTGNQGTETAAIEGAQSGATGTTETPAASGQSVVSRAEFEALRNQLAAADKKRVEAEQAHAQLRDKDMPQLEKLTRDLADATKVTEEMQDANRILRVENAFLTANEYEWHNSALALQSLDRSRITVDAEGNVQGMKDALKALATAHPYLLKPKVVEGEGEVSTGNVPPGTAPANGGIAPRQGAKTDVKEAKTRFPALRQRLG